MRIRHARTALELHELSHGDGVPLLLLHALGGSSADWGELPAGWPGPVYGLDFSGHGRSEWIRGGAYWSELLVADADVALEHIGRAALVGAGLGAYVALLLACARSAQVPAALLLPGRGLAGSPGPDFDRPFLRALTPAANPLLPAGCDPMLCALESDPRPPQYVADLAAAAGRLLLFEDDGERPPWWQRVRESRAVEVVGGDPATALARLAQTVPSPLAGEG